MRCLGRMMLQSQKLCIDQLPNVEKLMSSTSSDTVRVAAIGVLSAICDTYPSAFGHKLHCIGTLVLQQGDPAASQLHQW